MNLVTVQGLTYYTGFIDTIGAGDVFVFGSNLAGIHGKGAAKKALEFGAVWGRGKGLMGRAAGPQCYALPTKEADVRTRRRLGDIHAEAKELLQLVEASGKRFLLTAVGCGYAAYSPMDIAWMFAPGRKLPNLVYPEAFARVILKYS